MFFSTYADEQCRHGSQNSKCKYKRNDHGRVLGVGSEDVVDLCKLAISQRLLGSFDSGSRIPLDVEVENRSD